MNSAAIMVVGCGLLLAFPADNQMAKGVDSVKSSRKRFQVIVTECVISAKEKSIYLSVDKYGNMTDFGGHDLDPKYIPQLCTSGEKETPLIIKMAVVDPEKTPIAVVSKLIDAFRRQPHQATNHHLPIFLMGHMSTDTLSRALDNGPSHSVTGTRRIPSAEGLQLILAPDPATGGRMDLLRCCRMPPV